MHFIEFKKVKLVKAGCNVDKAGLPGTKKHSCSGSNMDAKDTFICNLRGSFPTFLPVESKKL